MKTIRVMIVLAFVMIGLINRHHHQAHQPVPVRRSTAQAAVDQDLLRNAERLTETLRQCNQTAHKNKETQ